MSSPNNAPANLAGSKIPLTPKGSGARILSSLFQNRLITAINALLNIKVACPQTDGQNVLDVKYADVQIGTGGAVITLPAMGAGGGGGSLELTDGVTDLNAVTKITVSGATVGGTPSAATLTIAGGTVTQFKIDSDGGDYWNCYTWNGASLGGSIIKVAKPFKIRAGAGAIATETIRGQVQNYAYSFVSSYYVRTVTDGSANFLEKDVVIPDALTNDIIYAMAFSTAAPASLVGVGWIDLNLDGRAWAEI